MKMRLILAFLIAVVICGCEKKEKVNNNISCVIDDLGREVEIKDSPDRIVTLAPNLTEFVFKLECGQKLIGNTTYCNYPDSAKSIEKVGDMLTIDYEKLVALNPDLIFVTIEGNTKETFDKLNKFGLKVFVSNPRDYDGIKKSFMDFAKILGKEKLAEDIITDWDERISIVRNGSERVDSINGMFMVSLKPIMLAGKNTFVNEYLNLCGIKNIAADVNINYPLFSREELLKRNPEVVFHTMNQYKETDLFLEAYPEWKEIKAARTKNFIWMDPDLYFRPGPRFVEAVEKMSEIVNNR